MQIQRITPSTELFFESTSGMDERPGSIEERSGSCGHWHEAKTILKKEKGKKISTLMLLGNVAAQSYLGEDLSFLIK